MRKKQKYMHFGEYGWPHWLPVDDLELRLLYRGAADMMEDQNPEITRLMVEQMMDNLIQDAIFADEVTPQWRSMAIMATAIRGILGDKIPAIKEDLW